MKTLKTLKSLRSAAGANLNQRTPQAAAAVVESASAKVKTISAPLGAAAASAFAKATERFDELQAQFRLLLAVWVKQKIQNRTERLVNKLPGIMKDYLEDDDMPRIVSRGKDRAVDAIWPDVREEIMWEVALMLDKQKQADSADNSPKPDCVRAFFRYHIHPCDKAIWGKLRDPIFVGFSALSCLPISAASPVAFLLLFILIDKSDEFQLVYFILWYKGMQFFSHGILRTVLGFFLYFACVTVPRNEDQHGCENLGPGLSGNFYIILGGWILQVVLVWTAWALLKCSQSKGRSELQGKIGHARTGTLKMGGYLRAFLLYDLVAFVVLCVVLVAVFMIRPGKRHDEWPVAHALFACQVVYGYLSMPFFFFTLPLLQSVLTHAVPTAYDREGRTVPWKGKQRKKKDKAKRDEEAAREAAQEEVTAEEANRLLDKVKVLFSGGTVDLDLARGPGEAGPGAPDVKAPVRHPTAGVEPASVGLSMRE